MSEGRPNEALEKLNRGIQDAKQNAQRQAIELAQNYFGDSVGDLKRQIHESRAALADLPDQIPGGQDKSFQILFQELTDNYTRMEECLEEAQENVANLDPAQLARQGEIEASDAARREAKELGIDLSQVEGTGSGGRVVIWDVEEFADKLEESSGPAGQATDQTGGAASQLTGQDDGAPRLTDAAASQVAEQAIGAARWADQIGETARRNAEGQIEQSDEQREGSEEPEATNAARRKATKLRVDLSKVEGTGTGGIITIKDVMQQ